ncbi:hypothetical protein BC629DRAFT_1437830 [Irpex lacteus]|nr:hypothetical protein BC629DRAFT_1437830 [Irpex lacteus]
MTNKVLLIFCDGTGQDGVLANALNDADAPGENGGARYATNVLKLFLTLNVPARAVLPESKHLAGKDLSSSYGNRSRSPRSLVSPRPLCPALTAVPTVPAPALNLPTPSNCVIAARSIPGGAPVPVLVLPDDENNTVLFPLTLFDSHRRFLYYGVIVYVDHEYKDLDLNSGSGVATPVNTLLDKKGAMHRECWPPENGGHTKTEVYDKYST